jgi:probable addiction module antidote protein
MAKATESVSKNQRAHSARRPSGAAEGEAACRGRRTKTVAYDVAEQLRTPEEIAAYLDAWFEEAPDDAAGIARALGDIARARGMTRVARDAGLSRESLYKALGDGGNPSFATVVKVARALGVRLHAQVAGNPR